MNHFSNCCLLGAIRRPSRDDRKAMQIGRLFEKIHQQETNRKGKRGKEKIEKSDNEQDGNNLESDDEPDDKKVTKIITGLPGIFTGYF